MLLQNIDLKHSSICIYNIIIAIQNNWIAMIDYFVLIDFIQNSYDVAIDFAYASIDSVLSSVNSNKLHVLDRNSISLADKSPSTVITLTRASISFILNSSDAFEQISTSDIVGVKSSSDNSTCRSCCDKSFN